MSDHAPLRLAVYVALLVLVFGAAWLVGRWVGPLAPGGASGPHGDAGHLVEGAS